MHIHADHCDDDMFLQEFKDYSRKVWSEAKCNFVSIDLTSGNLNDSNIEILMKEHKI